VIARSEWNDPDIHEGLMQDAEGRVICGTMSNVFAVIDDAVVTPDLSRCGVRGVMRRVVLEQARSLGIAVSEQDLERDELAAAAELFVTNALIGLWPVARLDRQRFGAGPVTRALMAALAAAGVAECAG